MSYSFECVVRVILVLATLLSMDVHIYEYQNGYRYSTTSNQAERERCVRRVLILCSEQKGESRFIKFHIINHGPSQPLDRE